MAETTTLLDAKGRPIQAGTTAPSPASRDRRTLSLRSILARYDAAQTVTENSRHWANADGLSARQANSAEVRRVLRDRARYECDESNCWAWGIVQTLGNHVVGTGPRLQMTTADDLINAAIEKEFNLWADAIGLAEKLRLMRQERAVLGEAFGLMVNNEELETPSPLDLLTLEADQIATPTIDPLDPKAIDGIEVNGLGKPRFYHILDNHPGDGIGWDWNGDYQRQPARFVLHWFRKIRSGQYRGIPDVTPALPLFAQLRRYCLATLSAAETAALFAVLLKSNLPPEEATVEGEPFESWEVERGMMTTLPNGYDVSQLKAEHPTTTHDAFVISKMREIARCFSMPLSIAMGDSANLNYASGRLDHQTYFKSIEVDQGHLIRVVLEPLFREWIVSMAAVKPDIIPGGPWRREGWPHQWLWPGLEHVDPQKEANAQAIKLANGMTSFDEECQRQGVDPETRAANIAKALQRWERLGIDPPAYVTPPMPARSGANSDEE